MYFVYAKRQLISWSVAKYKILTCQLLDKNIQLHFVGRLNVIKYSDPRVKIILPIYSNHQVTHIKTDRFI